MKKLQSVMAAALLAFGISATGCSGGGKCEKAVDKAMDLAMEMASGMAAGMGGDQAEQMKKEMKEKAEKEKPEAIKKCQEELKKNPEMEKDLDCIIDAKDFEALSKCNPGFSM